MASDLLGIGSSGLQAQQKMLATTSSNISNVNTQGYTRQSTVVYANQDTLGVGDSVTRRMINVYAQSEVWRDTSTYSQANTSYSELSQLDSLLSDSSTGLAGNIDSFFKSVQSANSSPNTASGRQGFMQQISGIVDQFQGVSTELSQQYDSINGKVGAEVTNVNTLLSSINDLNSQILKTSPDNDDGTRSNILDQRDDLIKQLSEKMDIRTVSQNNGTTLVNLSTGESLVLAGTCAQLSVVKGDPDPKQTGVQIQIGTAKTTTNNQTIGGTLGGYFSARDTIADTQREVGQLSLSFADAMNTQNSLGMTLNNTLGGNIFTLPTSSGLASDSNTGTGDLKVSIIPGLAKNLPSNDFQVTFTGANSFDVYTLDGNNKTLLSSGTTPPSTYQLSSYGVQIDVSGSPANGDSFVLQPARTAAGGVTTNITSSDDLALASPLKLSANSSNNGSATIGLTAVYNTDSSSVFSSSALSAAAPQSVVINSSGDYELYDGSGGLLSTVPASSKGQNLLSASGYYTDTTVSPGFDFSISGTVKAGDAFTIGFNSNGFSDNTNGLALSGLQSQDLVRKGNSAATDNKMTFNEAYASTVSSVGTTVSSLSTTKAAAEAKLTQSQEQYDSVAGVDLNEEAANLIRYQQAYTASAKVITAARDTFDALLSAVR
jgi:flagellar hook-associated protein 1